MAKKLTKQQAGKKRASLSLRDNKGRFTSNIFKREVIKTIAAKKGFDVSKDTTNKERQQIDSILKQAKVSQAELNREYKKNIDLFSDMIETGGLKTTFKNFNQIVDDINKYKGRFEIVRDGEKIPVTKAELKFELNKLKQFYSSNMDASDFSQKYTLGFDGKFSINVPDIEKMKDDFSGDIDKAEIDGLSDGDMFGGLEDYYDDPEDIIIYRSKK